jgi:hypothetical protein
MFEHKEISDDLYEQPLFHGPKRIVLEQPIRRFAIYCVGLGFPTSPTSGVLVEATKNWLEMCINRVVPKPSTFAYAKICIEVDLEKGLEEAIREF